MTLLSFVKTLQEPSKMESMKFVTMIKRYCAISSPYRKFKCQITADVSKVEKSDWYSINNFIFGVNSENVIAFIRML